MNKNMPIVLELQLDATNPEIKVVTLLRKAKIIASKLNQNKFINWVNNELNGYLDCTRDDLPKYRFVQGEIKALNPYHGWQPIYFLDSEGIEELRLAPIGHNIGGLETLIKSGKDLDFPLPDSVKQKIRESIGH